MLYYCPINTLQLTCHPLIGCQAVHKVTVALGWPQDGVLALTYTLTGDCTRMCIPPLQPQAQVDGLWQHTCFEAFIAAKDSPAYWEFNFSPSSEWVVYHFRGYRDRTPDGGIDTVPKIIVSQTDDHLQLDTRICLPPLLMRQPLRLALSAVIEDENGKLSYWALKHPPGKPDFHHSDAFTLELVPPKREVTRKEVR
jgi:hypothetical protein